MPTPKYTIPAKPDVKGLVAVINSEENLIHGSMCEDAGHCAVGAILAAVGVPQRRLKAQIVTALDTSSAYINRVLRRFGIDREDLDNILEVNDQKGGALTVTERRAAVIECIKSLPVRPRRFEHHEDEKYRKLVS